MTPEEIAAIEAAPLSHRMVAAATEIAEADVLDTMEQIDGALVAALLRAGSAEIERLRAIIDGRTTPPTDEECFAHQRAGGSWLADFGGVIGVLWTASHAGARGWRRISDPPVRWWSLDADNRLCAWPVVAEVAR